MWIFRVRKGIAGGSAFFQMLGKIGSKAPDVADAQYFKKSFAAVQSLIESGRVVAGHDVSAGGLVTTLLEMCFASVNLGASVDLTWMGEDDIVKLLFAQNPAVVLQVKDVHNVLEELKAQGVVAYAIGHARAGKDFTVKNGGKEYSFCVPGLR